jgi:hypothetical protein
MSGGLNFQAIHEAKQAHRAGHGSSLYYQSQRYYMCGPQGYSP